MDGSSVRNGIRCLCERGHALRLPDLRSRLLRRLCSDHRRIRGLVDRCVGRNALAQSNRWVTHSQCLYLLCLPSGTEPHALHVSRSESIWNRYSAFGNLRTHLSLPRGARVVLVCLERTGTVVFVVDDRTIVVSTRNRHRLGAGDLTVAHASVYGNRERRSGRPLEMCYGLLASRISRRV